jgi:hypothetical protein
MGETALNSINIWNERVLNSTRSSPESVSIYGAEQWTQMTTVTWECMQIRQRRMCDCLETLIPQIHEIANRKFQSECLWMSYIDYQVCFEILNQYHTWINNTIHTLRIELHVLTLSLNGTATNPTEETSPLATCLSIKPSDTTSLYFTR